MVILAPENGSRKLLPPDPSPIQLTQAQIIKRNADALRRSKAASWTRAANAQAAAAFARSQPSGATAGGAGKNTTPPRPVAVALPPPTLPPPSIPPPSIPPPIAKVPKLPALPPLPPPPLPPTKLPGNGTAAGGGGLPSPPRVAAAGGGVGILLMLGLALVASFGKR